MNTLNSTSQVERVETKTLSIRVAILADVPVDVETHVSAIAEQARRAFIAHNEGLRP